jgi:hypothetical protein
MRRKFLALAPEASIERAVNRAAEGLPVFASDLASVVDSLIADGIDSHDTARTSSPAPMPRVVQVRRKRYVIAGTVSSAERRTQFGRGTEVDAYPMLQGAPVGCPETLEAHRVESAARANDAAWERRNAYAESGTATTRANRNTARRRARRAK